MHSSDYHFGICVWESSQRDLSDKQKTVDELDATERMKFRCIDELRKIIPYEGQRDKWQHIKNKLLVTLGRLLSIYKALELLIQVSKQEINRDVTSRPASVIGASSGRLQNA